MRSRHACRIASGQLVAAHAASARRASSNLPSLRNVSESSLAAMHWVTASAETALRGDPRAAPAKQLKAIEQQVRRFTCTSSSAYLLEVLVPILVEGRDESTGRRSRGVCGGGSRRSRRVCGGGSRRGCAGGRCGRARTRRVRSTRGGGLVPDARRSRRGCRSRGRLGLGVCNHRRRLRRGSPAGGLDL